MEEKKVGDLPTLFELAHPQPPSPILTAPLPIQRAATMADLGFGTLASLPPELLNQVLNKVDEDLCYQEVVGAEYYHFLSSYGIPPGFFTPARRRSWMRDKGIYTFNGLASLCLVLRRLNEFTTARLYRDLDDFYINTGWWLLARTLVARRDLAALVKYLDLVKLTIPDDDLPLPSQPEVETYYANLLALDQDDGLPEDGLTSSDPDIVAEAATALMASLCPNLETLKCLSYYANEDGPMFGLCTPVSMPNL